MPDSRAVYTLWDTRQPAGGETRIEKARHDYRADMAWEANRRARGNAVLDQWDNAKEELDRLETKARDFLDCLDDIRASTYSAPDVAAIDAKGADFAGSIIDLLGDLHGRFQKRADDAGIAPESLTLDVSLLTEAFDLWTQRAEARR